MTIAFITGVTGMVGSHLVDFLLTNTDWRIFGMIRTRSSLENLKHLAKEINSGSRLKLVYGDLNDLSSIITALGKIRPDYIYHLAAQSFPKTSFDIPVETYTTNIIGTAHILECLRFLELDPLIHICSSSEVFGRVSKDQLPIAENCAFHPASPYAISKIGADLIARYHHEAYGQRVITTRMFTHTGPRRSEFFAESSFAKQIALIEEGLILPVIKVGNLNSMRTYADVRDAVRAYYMLLTMNPVSGEFYNIGGDYSCNVGDMLQRLLSLSHYSGEIEIEVVEDRLRPLDADLQVPDTSKFRNHTGWKPTYEFNQTLRDLLDYWRSAIHHNYSGIIR